MRARLLDRLERRWDRRLVTVVAGAGFGKTILLTTAINQTNAAANDPITRRDVWLCCEADDEHADHLVAGLTRALDLPPTEVPSLDAIHEWVASQAPNEVCFVFDDVHEIATGSQGAAVLSSLVNDLPRNGHVVLASRDPVPVSTSRLAVGGYLERLAEADLAFEHSEIEHFAAIRGVDPGLLRSTAGWPALAELTASGGADLVFDYLWDEILERIGLERAAHLARFARVGGGDDEVVSAIVGRSRRVEDLIEGVPLVERSASGWAALHPLWGPPLRRLVTDEEARDTLRDVAMIHRTRGRFTLAVNLLTEAEDWVGIVAVMREVEVEYATPPVVAGELGRWCHLLPPVWRRVPEALLATGLAREARAPLEAVEFFESAADGFRGNGDVDGELAAIARDGLVRWWIRDLRGLFVLLGRAGELAAGGSASARVLTSIGEASIAHLRGDSAKTLAALAGVNDALAGGWLPYIHWHRSVAHRRTGDLRKARAELDATTTIPTGRFASDIVSAGLHIDWLQGRVHDVCDGLGDLRAHYISTGDDFLRRETILELACKSAWVGDLDDASRCLAAAVDLVADMSGPLATILTVIAAAAIDVGTGDEVRAASRLHDGVHAALAGSDRWYWYDRAAIALPYVLLPETRALWARHAVSPTHQPGLLLAEALAAARAGDRSVVRAMTWPDTGIVRTHLPQRWIAELASEGIASENPPPNDLIDALGSFLPSTTTTLVAASSTSDSPMSPAARAVPVGRSGARNAMLRIAVIGTLELRLDGVRIDHGDLRRQRVRQLACYLVVKGRVRREEAAADLWPELDDGGRNLRVTLNYLQHLLEPDRAGRQPPFFVQVEGPWLALRCDKHLVVDAWELTGRLDEAAAAERAGRPLSALVAYRGALGLWRGEPFVDAPHATWAETARTRLRTRYSNALVRAGELELGESNLRDALVFAEAALVAETTSETAYRLVVRARLGLGDRAGARRALDDCRAALAELNLEPEPATIALLR